MENLISLRAFIIKAYKTWTEDNNSDCQSTARYIFSTHFYANFLSQKLELWMFVPSKLVDGVWVVLEEPKEYKNWVELQKQGGYSLCHNSNEYQTAKERCLFEGFEYIKEFNISRFSDHTEEALILGEGEDDIILYPKTFKDADDTYNIENLTYYDGLILLSPAAQKQLKTEK